MSTYTTFQISIVLVSVYLFAGSFTVAVSSIGAVDNYSLIVPVFIPLSRYMQLKTSSREWDMYKHKSSYTVVLCGKKSVPKSFENSTKNNFIRFLLSKAAGA